MPSSMTLLELMTYERAFVRLEIIRWSGMHVRVTVQVPDAEGVVGPPQHYMINPDDPADPGLQKLVGFLRGRA